MTDRKLPLEYPPRQAVRIYACRLVGLCLIALLSAVPLAYALLLYRFPHWMLAVTVISAVLAAWGLGTK